MTCLQRKSALKETGRSRGWREMREVVERMDGENAPRASFSSFFTHNNSSRLFLVLQ